MEQSTGLMESMKRLAGTVLAICQTRLALLTNEVEMEQLRIKQMLLYAGIALILFGLTCVVLTAFIVVLFWDSGPLLVLGGIAVTYFVAGILAWNGLRRLSREKSSLFSSSLAEFSKDRDHLAAQDHPGVSSDNFVPRT